MNIGKFFLVLSCSLLCHVSNVSSQWTRKADALHLRSDVPASVVYNGKLYVFFGFYDSLLRITSTVEVYDPVLDLWSPGTSIPPGEAMTHQGVILIDDNVWHIGGRVGNHPGPLTSEIWIYNISSDSWSRGPDLVDPATGTAFTWAAGGAALLGRTLHIYGGMVGGACKMDQSKYHLTLNIDEWLSSPSVPAPWKNNKAVMPVPRNHFSSLVLGGKIYALGGQFGHDCGGGQDQKYGHVYDPATNLWKQLPLLTNPHSHAEAANFAMDGKLYLVGGQGINGQSVNYVTVFDPSANNGVGLWSQDPNLTLPAYYEGLNAKLIDNTIIFAHGGIRASKYPQKATYVRTMSRNPVYKFGFSSDSIMLNVLTGFPKDTSTLVFTIDGRKEYQVTSTAEWLEVTRNSTGVAGMNGEDVYLRINSAAMLPGNYEAVLSVTGADDNPFYQPATFKVKVTVCSGTELNTYYADKDNDGYGSNTVSQSACDRPTGYVSTKGDCNDNNASIRPGVADICNNIDDDCDGQVDENCHRIGIDSVNITEGNSGSKSLRFTASLDKASTSQVTVRYATQNVTATTADYSGQAGTLTFASGVLKAYIDITTKGDVLDEWDETFNVILSQPMNAVLRNSTGRGMILDDDEKVNIIVSDTAATENALSAKPRVSLSAPSGKIVVVRYHTKNVTAIAPGDYTAQTLGTVSFQPGERTKYATITLKKDNISEPTETFQLVLKEPQSASITAPGSRSVASIRILNSAASASLGDQAGSGNSGIQVFVTPNPFRHNVELTFKSSSAARIDLQVDDMLGKTIEKHSSISNGARLQFGSTWKSGIYLMHILQGEERRTLKLIKVE